MCRNTLFERRREVGASPLRGSTRLIIFAAKLGLSAHGPSSISNCPPRQKGGSIVNALMTLLILRKRKVCNMTYAPNTDDFHHPKPNLLDKSVRDYVRYITGEMTPEGIKNICWAAFPEARSQTQLSEMVAAYLTNKNATVTPRTVRRWFSGESDPRSKYVRKLQRLMATEKVMTKLMG